MALGLTLAARRVVGAVDPPARPRPSTTTDPPCRRPTTVGHRGHVDHVHHVVDHHHEPTTTTSTTTVDHHRRRSTRRSLVPPLVDFRQPAELGGRSRRVDRVVAPHLGPRAAAARRRAPPAPELPFTGGGTLLVLVSGLAALAHRRRRGVVGQPEAPGARRPGANPTA